MEPSALRASTGGANPGSHPGWIANISAKTDGLLGVTGKSLMAESAPFAWICMRVLRVAPCMRLLLATPGGTATLICDEDTYSTLAGVPSKLTVPPASESDPPPDALTP